MRKPSPRRVRIVALSRLARGATNVGLLVSVALAGIAALVATAWIVLHGAGESLKRDDRRGADVGVTDARRDRRREEGPRDVELADRIRAEVERLRHPVRVTIEVRGPEGAPARGVMALAVGDFRLAGASDPSSSRFCSASEDDQGVVTFRELLGVLPEIPLLRFAAANLAGVAFERIVLPGCDVELEPVELAAGRSLRGRVKGPAGEAIREARVELWDPGADRTEPTALPNEALLEGFALTDGRGDFALDHVARSNVRLVVRGPPGFANGGIPSLDVSSEPVVLELERPASIRGVVVDLNGKPVGGARLDAAMAGPDERSWDLWACSDYETGSFRLDELAPGYYVVTTRKEDCAPTVIDRVHTDVADLRVVLHALASAQVELLGAPKELDVPVTWRTVAPAGAVHRPTSAPRVAWMRDGQLEIRGIAAGSHALELSVPGAMAVITPAVAFELDATTELGSFTLQRGATVTATAAATGGAPLAARVALASPHQNAIALERDLFVLPDHLERVCAKDGRLEWLALPPGERVLAFRHPGFADRNVKVTIPESGSVVLGAITLEPAGTIEGQLRTPAGRPLADVEMTARLVAGPTSRTTTDCDGRFRFPRLKPGRYELTALRIDVAPPADLGAALSPKENPTKLVDVATGETKRCDLTLELE